MHISPENLETLFGKGAKLTVHKWLYQEGQFASEQTVTLIGPRRRVIPNLRILGPCRNLTQIELASPTPSSSAWTFRSACRATSRERRADT